jgi:hypothetical protein
MQCAFRYSAAVLKSHDLGVREKIDGLLLFPIRMEMSPAQPPFSFFAEELAHVLGKAGHDCAYTKTRGLLWAIQKSGLHARAIG